MTALMPTTIIGLAVANLTLGGPIYQFRQVVPRNVLLFANLTANGNGTSVDAYVQSTVDGGTTWYDLCNFHFGNASSSKLFNLSSLTPQANITPTYGNIAANTSQDGVIGSKLQVLYKTSGNFTGNSTFSVSCIAPGLTV